MQGEPDREKRAIIVLGVEMGLQRVRKEVHVDAIKKVALASQVPLPGSRKVRR